MTVSSIQSVYQAAWNNLHDQIEAGKTSYGRNELRQMMHDCLSRALNEAGLEEQGREA